MCEDQDDHRELLLWFVYEVLQLTTLELAMPERIWFRWSVKVELWG
jgi:hypothetical protein